MNEADNKILPGFFMRLPIEALQASQRKQLRESIKVDDEEWAWVERMMFGEINGMNRPGIVGGSNS